MITKRVTVVEVHARYRLIIELLEERDWRLTDLAIKIHDLPLFNKTIVGAKLIIKKMEKLGYVASVFYGRDCFMTIGDVELEADIPPSLYQKLIKSKQHEVRSLSLALSNWKPPKLS
jgi:hypothetical protein